MTDKITANSIRSVKRLKTLARGVEVVHLVRALQEVEQELLRRIGFTSTPELGDHLVPAPIGKISFHNANGGEITRRDLPKENRTVESFRSWKDWHGQEHSGYQSRTIEAYPRESIEAPSLELSIIEIDDVKYIATPPISLNEEHSETATHAANLMLECFGELQMIDPEEAVLIAPKVRRLHWEILPEGIYPWERAKPLVEESLSRINSDNHDEIEFRMKVLADRNPNFFAVGIGGFSGYYVFGYSEKNLYILESTYLDNATYVFSEEWEQFSTLSKSEIINGAVPHQRIVHNKRWRFQLRQLLA